MKLLVVDLQSPNETHYHDPNTIGAFLLGRRLSNYPMFAVKDDGTMKKIVVDSADVTEIEKQVLEQLNDTKELTVTEPTKPAPTKQSIARTQRETTITKENLDRLWNALEYTRATISPSNNFKSKENPGWVEIHGGRSHQSESYLNQAIDLVNEMKKELK